MTAVELTNDEVEITNVEETQDEKIEAQAVEADTEGMNPNHILEINYRDVVKMFITKQGETFYLDLDDKELSEKGIFTLASSVEQKAKALDLFVTYCIEWGKELQEWEEKKMQEARDAGIDVDHTDDDDQLS